MQYPPLHSLYYTVPYVLVLLIYWFSYRISESVGIKNNKEEYSRIVLFVWIIYFFFIGFRGFICTDWYNYYPMFNETPSILNYNEFITYTNTTFTEIGYLLYISIFKIFTDDYVIFQALSVLVDIFLIHLCIKRYSTNYLLSFILLSVFFYVQSVNLNRNIKSTLLFLYSIKYLHENRHSKFLIINSVGVLFHSLSIVYLCVAYFLKRNFPQRVLYIFFVLGYMFYFSRISVISLAFQQIDNLIEGIGKIGHAIHVYIAREGIERLPLFSIGMLERLMTFILLITNYKRIIVRFKYGVYFCNMLLLYLLCYLFLSEIPVVSIRFCQLFSFSYVIFYAYVFSLVKNSKNIRIYRWILFLYILLWTCSTHDALMDKYDNFLLRHKSFEERVRIYDHYGSDYIKG